MEKPWHESNNVRANVGQTARSGPRKCAERTAHEKGRDALPLTFVSSWSTTLAAGFNNVSPHEYRSHQRPLPQMMPQAPTMFAATMPHAPTTSAARNAATVNDRANDAPLNTHRPPQNSPGKDRLLGGGLLASSGGCANLCCRGLRTGVAGRVSCFCALRVRAAPSRLIAPSRPPINRHIIPRRVCLRWLWLGRSLFGLKQRMLLFQFLPLK